MSNLYGFQPGQLYNRRKDIHDRFAGQEQAGIITPKDARAVFIITGDAGATYGYHDRFRADGIMEYYGEGQRGDMQFMRGNLAIRQHRADQKSLLLFQKQDGQLRFLGPMQYAGHRIEHGRDVNGVNRKVIVFLLERDQSEG